MHSSLLNPQWLIGAGVLCLLLAAAMVLCLLLVIVAVWMRRPAAQSRDEMLEEIGYKHLSSEQWSLPVFDTSIVFEEKQGWRFTVRLPRYNTMSLNIEERQGGASPAFAPFQTDNPELDARFVMASERAAQSIALARNRDVGRALLAMPYLSLRLHGDELVLSDQARRGLAKLTTKTKEGPAMDKVAAERLIHERVVALVGAIFDCMYAKDSGTILPEHR